MDVITKTPLNEAVRSPLKELQTRAPIFKEEYEIIQSGANAPVDTDNSGTNLNFVEQNPNPVISKIASVDWTVFGNPQPYSQLIRTHYDYLGISGYTPPNWLLDTLGYVNGGGGITRIMGPKPPLVLSGGLVDKWQHWQYSVWSYDPAFNINPTSTLHNQWWDWTYAHKTRFRCTQPVTVWTASGLLMSAQTTDGQNFTPCPYDATCGNGFIGGLMIFQNAAQIMTQPSTVPANTWIEVHTPDVVISQGLPSRSTGFVGKIWFAVHTETMAQWSARTGIRLQ